MRLPLRVSGCVSFAQGSSAKKKTHLEAVRSDLVPVLFSVPGHSDVAFKGSRDGVESDGDAASRKASARDLRVTRNDALVLLEQRHQTPDRHPRTILELRLGRRIALSRNRNELISRSQLPNLWQDKKRGTHMSYRPKLVQHRLACLISVLDCSLASLLVVEHKVDGDLGSLGPVGVRRVVGVSDLGSEVG